MFSLGQGINYFDKDEVLDNEYFKEYLTIKNSDSLSKNSNNEDLFFLISSMVTLLFWNKIVYRFYSLGLFKKFT